MSRIGERDMPVIEAWAAEPWPCRVWAAAFPDGLRHYPSPNAVRRAAARAGASVLFVDPASRSAAHPEVTPRTLSAEPPSSTRDASTSQPVASGEVVFPG